MRSDYGVHEAAMQAYQRDGEQRALALNNRGPIRLTDRGQLHPDIAEAYSVYGFYIFESVIHEAELADLDADFQEIRARLPVAEGNALDSLGRPAIGVESESVPLICAPGDVVMCNRQTVHGSFANTSREWRVTFNQGFHRRASVLGAWGGGLQNKRAQYDQARIDQRARVLGYAIDARQQRFPSEVPFQYLPLKQSPNSFVWSDDARQALHDYNLLDLGI